MDQQAEAVANAEGTQKVIYEHGTIISFTTHPGGSLNPIILYVHQHQEKGKLYGSSRSLSDDLIVGRQLTKKLKKDRRRRQRDYIPMKIMHHIKIIKTNVPESEIE